MTETVTNVTAELIEQVTTDLSTFKQFLSPAVKKGWGPSIYAAISEEMGLNTADFRKVKVILTFDDMMPMTLIFARQLSQEQNDTKQAWIGMTEDEQKTRQNEYNVRVMSKMIQQDPVGLPDWPDIAKGSLEDRFIKYFLAYENKALFTFVENAYYYKISPKELLR